MQDVSPNGLVSQATSQAPQMTSSNANANADSSVDKAVEQVYQVKLLLLIDFLPCICIVDDHYDLYTNSSFCAHMSRIHTQPPHSQLVHTAIQAELHTRITNPNVCLICLISG